MSHASILPLREDDIVLQDVVKVDVQAAMAIEDRDRPITVHV